jgi:hypothetical protein
VTIQAAQTNNKSVSAANIVIHKTPTITFAKMLQLTRKQVDHLGFAFRHCTLNLALSSWDNFGKRTGCLTERVVCRSRLPIGFDHLLVEVCQLAQRLLS